MSELYAGAMPMLLKEDLMKNFASARFGAICEGEMGGNPWQ